MGFQEIKNLAIPMLVIGCGLFIKTTKNKNYQNVKSWWKLLVILGAISLVLSIISLSI